jgi:hypothetical protein
MIAPNTIKPVVMKRARLAAFSFHHRVNPPYGLFSGAIGLAKLQTRGPHKIVRRPV